MDVLLSVNLPTSVGLVKVVEVGHSSVVIFLDPSHPESMVHLSPVHPHGVLLFPELVNSSVQLVVVHTEVSPSSSDGDFSGVEVLSLVHEPGVLGVHPLELGFVSLLGVDVVFLAHSLGSVREFPDLDVLGELLGSGVESSDVTIGNLFEPSVVSVDPGLEVMKSVGSESGTTESSSLTLTLY